MCDLVETRWYLLKMSFNQLNGSGVNHSYLEDSGVYLGTKQNQPVNHTLRPPRILYKTVSSATPIYHLPRCIVGIEHSNGIFPSPLYNRMRDQNYLYQCYEILHKIGEGSFGTVYKVRSKEDNRLYAVKIFKEPFRNKTHRKQVLEEVMRHQQLSKHPNIVSMYQAWEDEGYLFILLELCETSLEIYSQENHNVSESMVWDILLDMLHAVKHIHDMNLLHLDIKLGNILLGRDGSFKLSDFGLIVDISEVRDPKEVVEGDSKYLAPEVMQGTFTKAADIFSLGISVLEIACDLVLPGCGEEWHHLRQDKIPQVQTARLSTELVQVITAMMTQDFRHRPTADDILRSPFIQKKMKLRKLMKFLRCLRYLGKNLLSLGFYPVSQLMRLWTRLRTVLFGNRQIIKASTPTRSPINLKIPGIGHSTPILGTSENNLLDFSANRSMLGQSRSNLRPRDQQNIVSQKVIFARRRLCYNSSDSE